MDVSNMNPKPNLVTRVSGKQARAYSVLEDAIGAATTTPAGLELAPESSGLAAWSMVHGFSHLALGTRLRGPHNEAMSNANMLESVLPLVMKYLPGAGRSGVKSSSLHRSGHWLFTLSRHGVC